MPRLVLLTMSLLLILFAAGASAERKVALVVGNSEYRQVNQLPNPVNDADAIAASLRKLDFEVTLLTNGTKSDFEQALGDFSEKASGSDLALVYYAGHGLEMDGVNYLIPVDARLKSDLRVPLESVSLNTVLDSISGARKLRMVLLDACRNNPFAAKITRSVGSTRSIGRGLADVKAGPNELISYAAASGAEAADGLGRHSPYTAALLAHIEKPDVEVGKLFRIIAAEVQTSTNGQQIPYESSRLPPEDIFLKQGETPEPAKEEVAKLDPEPVSVPPVIPAGNAIEEWKLVKESRSPEAMRAFIEKYAGDKLYRALAEQELAALSPKDVKPPVGAQSMLPETATAPETSCDKLAASPDDPLKPASVEGVLSDDLQATSAIAACLAAINQYPLEARFKYQLARGMLKSKSYVRAKDLLEEAWDMKYPTAASGLGYIHVNGLGTRRDNRRALEWFRKGRDARNGPSVCNLASLYIDGFGVQRDLKIALSLAEQCVELGTKRGYLLKALAFAKWNEFDSAGIALLDGLKSGDVATLDNIERRSNAWSPSVRKALQRRMRAEGLYSGPVDGAFGAQTKSAVRALFESASRR